MNFTTLALPVNSDHCTAIALIIKAKMQDPERRKLFGIKLAMMTLKSKKKGGEVE